MNVIDPKLRLRSERMRDFWRNLQAYSMAFGTLCHRAEDSMLELSNTLERIRQTQLTNEQK